MLLSVPLTAIEAAFDEFGPIPRLCFESRMWSSYRKIPNIALDNLSLGYLESLSFRRPFAFDDFSQKMLILRRSTIDLDSINLDFPSVYIQLISPFVESKVMGRMWVLERYEQVNLFKRYSSFPFTRGMSGNIFEAYCHTIFC